MTTVLNETAASGWGSCCNTQMGRWSKKKIRRSNSAHLSSAGKKSSLTMMKQKSKEEKNQNNGSQKIEYRGQIIWYRSWWRQGILKNDSKRGYASCWVHKDLTATTKKIRFLLTAARASGGKDNCHVRLTGIGREYWIGTEIGRLGSYGFRGAVKAGDGSNQKGKKIGANYLILRKKW